MNYTRNRIEPGSACLIDDDVEAARILVDHGLIGQMEPKFGFTHCNTCFHTEHHWCLATRDIGHADPVDNGYAVVMLPKSGFTLEQAGEFFADMIGNTTAGLRIGITVQAETAVNG